MVSIEVIGNIGADAKIVDYNGAKFMSFNVCDNRKVNDQEVSQWYGCNMNRVSDNLMKFLKKGQTVFVRGIPRYRIFDSAEHRCKCVAIDILVNDLQLIGSAPKPADGDGYRTEKPAGRGKGAARKSDNVPIY